MKNRIFIDIEDLVQVIDTMAEEESIFLNLESGKFAALSEWGGIVDSDGNFIDDVDVFKSKKYLNIPYIESKQRLTEIIAFIKKIGNKELQQRLYQIVKEKKAIRFFLSELAKFPPEYDQWVEFKEICTRQRLYDWLDQNHIDWQKKLS